MQHAVGGDPRIGFAVPNSDSGLTGVLYVLDEPSSACYQRDTTSVNHAQKPGDQGNTVIRCGT